MIDKNCLSYWFPKLLQSGVLVPKTVIVETECDLYAFNDGETPVKFDEFLAEINRAATNFTLPLFLRTGHTSGKHDWRNTCFIEDVAQFPENICSLIEYSSLVDFIGLPLRIWVLREFLELDVLETLPRFNGMPLAKEFRAFVEDGEIKSIHPYWPKGAIEQGLGFNQFYVENYAGILADALTAINPVDQEVAGHMLKSVAETFKGDGAWGVDICRAKNGNWYVTDMAIAEQSFHWPECPRLEPQVLVMPDFEAMLEDVPA